MLFQDRGVKANHDHVLQAIDLDKRVAHYKTPAGTAEQAYDFINVVPPMRAHDVWEKTIVSRRLVHAELLGLLGGGPTLVIMAQVSSSGFTDAGGPADWFLIVLVYGVGLVATIVLTYSGWAGCRCGAKALKRSQAAASRPL
jgi:hypothetical protein